MYRAQCVLAMLALCIGVARSWDFAVSSGDQLTFHTKDGNETDRVRIQSRNIGGLAYDVVHNRMLYVDKQNNNDTICGYNLSSKENECFMVRSGRNILSIAYDPVTEKLFFTDANEKSINWISLKRGYENNTYGNLLIKMDDRTPDDIAVDSCGGYIYWSNTGHAETVNDMERIRFSGTGRKALHTDFDSYDVCSLSIDRQNHKIYYFDYNKNSRYSLNAANMNGRHVKIKFLISIWSEAKELIVSKDYVYFMSSISGNSYKSVYRLSKKEVEGPVSPEEITRFHTNGSLGLAANYKIEDQIEGLQDCATLSNLIQTTTGAPGTTCERCDVCVNYCFLGTCSINDEGLPKCSCDAGYSGERCEVPACLHYCFQGNCSVSDEGHPTCSCYEGYSGERCEVSACQGTVSTTANVP